MRARGNVVAFTGALKASGVTITDSLVYEDKKPSYRSEVTRVLATTPDLIMLGGYTPDSVVMAKDIYKAGYKGAILGPSFAINAKFIEGVGPDVAEGIWNMDRAPLFDSPAYKEFSAAVPRGDQSPYAPQAWDQISLVALALAAAKGEVSGTAIKDNLRAVSNPPGAAAYSFADGAKLLHEGKKINYEGASGACDFDQIGDILSAPFSVQQVRKGKSEPVLIIALILGGSGNNRGALLGSAVLLGLLEGSRFLKDVIPFLTGVRLAAVCSRR